MTLVQLRHLLALADAGSFRRAADAVFLTQPALSRSIQSLESELGQRVFDRIGWRIELTPFGREVLTRARRLIADADELSDIGQLQREGRVGSVSIGLGSGPGAVLMVPLLHHLAIHHPGLKIDIARGGTALLEQGLRDNRLDAIVVDSRALTPSDDLQVEHVAELPGAFMCRPGHPLLDVAGPLRFEDLARFPLASTPLSDAIAQVLVERYGPVAHPGYAVTLRCEEIAALVEAARHSDAVVLAIRVAAPDLVELQLSPALQATARFGLVTRARRSASPALALLRQIVIDILNRL